MLLQIPADEWGTLVIGLGNFGATVARELSRLKCKVTAIDNDKGRVHSVQDEIHMAILADATEREFLQHLEVDKFDCFVVSTGENTHASILITLHLKELGAKRIIVKAKTDDHAKVLMKVGATQAATRIAHSITESNLIDFLPLTGEFYVAELAPPPKFVGKSLKELKIRTKYNVLIVAVKDTSGKLIFVPGGEYQVKASDILLILGEAGNIEQIK
jgi:trk system potassium uptake protein TrkA